ncbi:MAG: tRNA (N6-isopentenyl adenosine(37)-C2)-methylthiotransferase MiaB [Lutibacter sp.]|nr:tRNA (N6-isopentenyl adenosine(37)-C2)-methylthiotransferase MiaB [Lutibacter sp.]
MKKVYIETLGCQMNKSDTEKILGMLDYLGYEEVCELKNKDSADLLIINTCSIRQLSEDKAYSRIGLWGKWKKDRPELKIVFCGCVAQQDGKEVFKRAPYVDLVMGTHNINEFPDLIKRIENGEKIIANDETPIEEKDFPLKRTKGVNAWITITEGCDNFCTYCIVPYTRGRERSRVPEIIIKEAKEALEQGFKEITLLGQNVDSYNKKEISKGEIGKEINLAYLLRKLNSFDGDFRIRFTTSYPADITDELIDTVVNCEKVCEYFHIPMQSGSSEVLKKMNRRYDRETYAKIVKKVREKVKDVTITSDFIAGFPGETEEQFNETLSAMREFELDYSNTAAYSPRRQTIAAKREEFFLSEEVKKDRLERLNEQNKQNCLASNQKYIGREMEVLVDIFLNHKGKNILTGRTRNNKIVHTPYDKDLVGEFITVKITGAKTWYLKGEII